MVNFKKLSDRASKAREAIDNQGGPDALKEKAERMRDAARGRGSVADRAKAAAAVAREKPHPASPPTGAPATAGGSDASAEPAGRAEPTEQ